MVPLMARTHPLSSKPLDPDEKLTIGEAAIVCGVDYDTFLRWVRKGVLPHVLVGPAKSIRVTRRDVDALIVPGS